MYLTRRNCEAASRLWLEMLRLTLAGSASPSHPQIYFLSDQSVAAVMQRYPEDVSQGAAAGLKGRGPGAARTHSVADDAAGGGTLLLHLGSMIRVSTASIWLTCLQAHWHRNTALLRLAKLVPWGKWR